MIDGIFRSFLKPPKIGNAGSLELLILQPTPFCNLDCSYCYLPDRGNTKRMPMSIVEATIQKVLSSGIVDKDIRVLWHAGEPMAVGLEFYKDAFEIIEKNVNEHGRGIRATHSIQTNATLINDKWCEFFKKKRFEIGVSVDGPEFINDKYRKHRNGKGSHSITMRGIELLRKHDIPFSTISVLTDYALDHSDALFEFFMNIRPIQVGFNVEEEEGSNEESTLVVESAIARYSAFISRFYDLNQKFGNKLNIREIENRRNAIFGLNAYNTQVMKFLGAQENAPFRIINVDCDGNFSTFSPELLGMEIEPYGKFILGNVMKEEIAASMKTEKFMRISSDIQEGVKKCANECQYFGVCGGGAPANKYYENGSFATSETLRCKLQIKAVSEVVLHKIQEAHGSKSAASVS